MTNFICATCGTQFAATEQPPAECAICQDPRQVVPPAEQQWTSLEGLRARHRDCICGAFGDRVIRSTAPDIVRRSVACYLTAIDSPGSTS
jgi:hypothetical protein